MKEKFEKPAQSDLERNLREMGSSMMKVLLQESVGSNAGDVRLDGKRYVCAAVNGYADARTGKILAFGDYQDIAGEIWDSNPEFTFRFALGPRTFEVYKIADLFIKGAFSENAVNTLRQSMEKWNESRRK